MKLAVSREFVYFVAGVLMGWTIAYSSAVTVIKLDRQTRPDERVYEYVPIEVPASQHADSAGH